MSEGRLWQHFGAKQVGHLLHNSAVHWQLKGETDTAAPPSPGPDRDVYVFQKPFKKRTSNQTRIRTKVACAESAKYLRLNTEMKLIFNQTRGASGQLSEQMLARVKET